MLNTHTNTNTSTAKKPAAADVHIGARIRMRRTLLGMSQETLGAKLGVTFQQVQKYEKGKNRVGGSRMHAIAAVLQVEPAFFFEGLAGESVAPAPEQDELTRFLLSRDGLRLNRAFLAIESEAVRRHLIGLAVAFAGGETPDTAH